jgi:hypothetical protein
MKKIIISEQTKARLKKLAGIITEESLNEDQEVETITLGGKTYTVGEDDPNDDGIITSIEKLPKGYLILGGVWRHIEDYHDGEEPREAYGYGVDLSGNMVDEEDLEG